MDSLYIKNFKNLKELTIPSLMPVNLIFGGNNSGKSSLLEALSVYLSNGSEENLRNILRGRGFYAALGMQSKSDNDAFLRYIKDYYLSLFSGMSEDYSNDFSIQIGERKDDRGNVFIRQVHLAQMLTDRGGMEYKIQVLSPDKQVSVDGADELFDGLEVSAGNSSYIIRYPYPRQSSLPMQGKKNFCYVRTSDFDVSKNAKLYDAIALSPNEKYVIEALNVISPDVERITFINEPLSTLPIGRYPVVSLKNNGGRIRVSSMGDGINRILTIILAMLNSIDGVLLIDEFENGLHYSVQQKLWNIIFMLSEKLNIQVFATTHSNDCISGFTQANTSGLGQGIRLDNISDGVTATIYDNNADLSFAIDNSIEIR